VKASKTAVCSLKMVNTPQFPMPVKWKIKGKSMGPPDMYGEFFWTTYSTVTGTFKTVSGSSHSNPIIQFFAATKGVSSVDTREEEKPTLPIYSYAIEVGFRTGKAATSFNMMVYRYFDAESRTCTVDIGRMQYRLSNVDPHYGCSLEDGVWRAIITGDVNDRIPHYTPMWAAIIPLLLEMSEASDMRKMEALFLK
jgi:hypothetical protein